MKATVIKPLEGLYSKLDLGELVYAEKARFVDNCYNVTRASGERICSVPAEHLEVEK